MTENEQEERPARAGERRGTERRRGDRRSNERRTPPPPWRQPWALVAYGVVGALGIVLLWNLATADRSPAVEEEPLVVDAPLDTPALAIDPPPATGIEDAFGTEGFERLMVAGEAAVGRVVRAELFCGSASNFAVVAGHTAPRSVTELIQEGRVPAAECKWGQSSAGQSRPDFLLLVPPGLADSFSSAPVVSDNYVERRHLIVEVEWVGRSETLALRTAGVFRGRTRR